MPSPARKLLDQIAKKSKLEQTFDGIVKSHHLVYGIPIPEEEVMFHPERQWRFDRAWPELFVGVELEGLTAPGREELVHTGNELKRKKKGAGRHQRIAGYTEDCRKYNEALLHGWKVFRFTQPMLREGKVEQFLRWLFPDQVE